MANVEKILVLAFFGAGQTKYGGLLLDRILEDQKAPNLARALRAAQLVNISGRPNSWQGADHFQEQLNRRLKMYDYSHATDQAIVRFEDRISAFLGIGEEILNEIKESFGSSATARRQRDRIERADVRLIARDSEALKLEAADPKRPNNLPETKQTKNRHKAMAQAEAVWDSIKGGAWSLVKSGAIKDNLAQGYLNLLNGGLDRHRNKVRDVLSRDADVVSLVQEQTGTINAREDEVEGAEPELGDEQIRDAELALGEQGGSRTRGLHGDSDEELDQDEM